MIVSFVIGMEMIGKMFIYTVVGGFVLVGAFVLVALVMRPRRAGSKLTVIFEKIRNWFKNLLPKTKSKQPKIETETESRRLRQPFPLFLFWSIVVAVNVLWLGLNVALLMFTSGEKIGINPGWLSFIVQFVYNAASFKSIRSDEIGARLFFGRPINNLKSGPAFLPLIFTTLTRETKNYIQIEIPAEPQYIYRTNEGEESIPKKMVDEGYRRPLRVTFKADDPKEWGNPLRRQITVEVTPVVTGRVKDLCTFLGTIRTIEEAEVQLEDVCVTFCTQQLSSKVLQDVLDDMEVVNSKLFEAVRDLVYGTDDSSSWGFEIKSAVIKQIPIPRKVNAAIESGPIEVAQAHGVRAKAQGERDRLELLGRGTASARKALLDAETEAYQKRITALDMTGRETVAAETATAFSRNEGQVVIAGSQGFSDLIGTASAIQKTLQNLPAKPPVPPAAPEPTPTPT